MVKKKKKGYKVRRGKDLGIAGANMIKTHCIKL